MYSDRSPTSPTWLHRAAACIAAALLVCVPTPAHAHDFWIQPAQYAPAPGTTLDLRLIIGHDEERTDYARNVRHVVAFVCFDPSGKMRHVPGIHGRIAGQFPVEAAGLHLFAYRSHWNFLSHAPNKFAAYLQKEDLREALARYLKLVDRAAGLPLVREPALDAPHDPAAVAYALRMHGRCIRAGCRPVREQFSRCAKSLVAVDGKGAGKHDRVVGLPLEIVAESNPYTTELRAPLSFRVLLRGKPHAHARLAAYREHEPAVVVETRTDAAGRATLPLDQPGMWIVRCIRVEHVQSSQVDWQSLWATLTFART